MVISEWHQLTETKHYTKAFDKLDSLIEEFTWGDLREKVLQVASRQMELTKIKSRNEKAAEEILRLCCGRPTSALKI